MTDKTGPKTWIKDWLDTKPNNDPNPHRWASDTDSLDNRVIGRTWNKTPFKLRRIRRGHGDVTAPPHPMESHRLLNRERTAWAWARLGNNFSLLNNKFHKHFKCNTVWISYEAGAQNKALRICKYVQWKSKRNNKEAKFWQLRSGQWPVILIRTLNSWQYRHNQIQKTVVNFKWMEVLSYLWTSSRIRRLGYPFQYKEDKSIVVESLTLVLQQSKIYTSICI